MTSRTFLCEGHRHTDLGCVEGLRSSRTRERSEDLKSHDFSYQPWPLEITP